MKWLLLLLFPLNLHAASFSLSSTIPPQAKEHLPALKTQITEVWPTMPEPAYFGALVEHESGCPSLPRMCWSPKAQLKTKREEGAGFGQLTRAFREDGSIRFDALEDVKRLDRKGLNELRWETVYTRPDLQLRVMVIMVRQSWNRLVPLVPTDEERLKFTDAAYNGGLGGVMNERRACGLRKDCDPNVWINNVEKTCLKSTKPIYGTRSACDINRHHVTDVMLRMPKYRSYLKKD